MRNFRHYFHNDDMFSTRTLTLFLIVLSAIGVLYVCFISMDHQGTFTNTKNTIEEKYINVLVKDKRTQVFYRKLDPPTKRIIDSRAKLDVLLLHGPTFSSQTWKDLKTMGVLAEHGHRVVAVDLPGSGYTHELVQMSDDNTRAEFMTEVIKLTGLHKPAIVSPSMSGKYSLPLLIFRTDFVGAFIPVAPGGTERFLREQYENIRVPTLIAYGDRDTGKGLESLSNLVNLPLHEVFVLPDATHHAYLDQPDLWHFKLTSFLDSLQVYSGPVKSYVTHEEGSLK